MRINKLHRTILILFTLTISNIGIAAPYQPANDFVLLKVETTDLVAMYKTRINKAPNSAVVLLEAANVLLKKAKQENSELLFGKIEAILLQHKEVVIKNNSLKIYYADVLQHRHAFSAAQQYLEGINSPEAILLRSTIHQNLGEYAAASRECKKLIGRVNILIASTCLLHAESYRGNLKKSYATLEKLSKQVVGDQNSFQVWILTALADMGSRMGLANESIEYYTQSLKLKPDDAHTLSEFADVLFNNNMQEEIVRLLKDNHADLRLSLRYQRSRKELNVVNSEKDIADLEELKRSIKLIELREDKRHYDSRAEYYIWIEKNPDKALYWAKENWNISKTPNVAKLLLLALKLKNNVRVYNEIKQWIKESNIEDEILNKLVIRLYGHEVFA